MWHLSLFFFLLLATSCSFTSYNVCIVNNEVYKVGDHVPSMENLPPGICTSYCKCSTNGVLVCRNTKCASNSDNSMIQALGMSNTYQNLDDIVYPLNSNAGGISNTYYQDTNEIAYPMKQDEENIMPIPNQENIMPIPNQENIMPIPNQENIMPISNQKNIMPISNPLNVIPLSDALNIVPLPNGFYGRSLNSDSKNNPNQKKIDEESVPNKNKEDLVMKSGVSGGSLSDVQLRKNKKCIVDNKEYQVGQKVSIPLPSILEFECVCVSSGRVKCTSKTYFRSRLNQKSNEVESDSSMEELPLARGFYGRSLNSDSKNNPNQKKIDKESETNKNKEDLVMKSVQLRKNNKCKVDNKEYQVGQKVPDHLPSKLGFVCVCVSSGRVKCTSKIYFRSRLNQKSNEVESDSSMEELPLAREIN